MPDSKVIGKISNTLEEIRDILTGKISSKLHNSIQQIASANLNLVDLMTELVDSTNETKKVVLRNSVLSRGGSEKILKTTNKTLDKIKDILDGMSDSLKKISDKASIGNLSPRDSKRLLENIIKDAQKNTRDDKLLGMINIVSKLRDVKLKDFVTARVKVKEITKIYESLVKSFSKFKNDKEIKKVNEFAVSAIDIVKKLSKIAFLSKLSTLGAKAIDEVFFGKGGLVTTMEKMSKKKKEIVNAKKLANDMLIISGKVFGVTVLMTGVALLGVPALVGSLMSAAIMGAFGLTFALIGKMEKPILKGSVAVGGMMTAVILAGAGLLLINKATKDLEWEQLGKAGAAILGFGTVTALLGIPVVAAAIGLGSVALGAMGLGLIAIAGGVSIFGLLVTDKAIDKIEYGIPRIMKAMTSVFGGGDEVGNTSFGDSVLGIITGGMKLGGVFFASSALLFASVALGFAGLALRSWENFNIKAIDNIDYAVSRLDDCLGLGLRNNRHSEGGIITQSIGVVSDGMGLVSTLLQSGKTMFTMGTVLFSSIVLGLVRGMLDDWSNFNMSSLDKIDMAMSKLDDIFGLGIKDKPKGFLGNLKTNLTGFNTLSANLFDLGATILRSGGVFVKMGTLLLAVGTSKLILEQINKLKGISLRDSDMDKILNPVQKFGEFFGITFDNNTNDNRNIFQRGFDSVVGLTGSIFETGKALMDAGGQFTKLGVLSTAVGVVDKLINAMIKAGKNTRLMNGSLNQVFSSFNTIIEYFFNDKRLNGSILFDDRTTKLSILSKSVDIVSDMVGVITKMGKYSGNVRSSLATTFSALNILVDYMFGNVDRNKSGALNRVAKAMAKSKSGSWFSDGSSEVTTQIEVLSSCVGVVSTMTNALYKMKNLTPNIEKAVNNVFYALNMICNHFFGSVGRDKSNVLNKVAKAMAKAKSSGSLFGLFGDGSSQINSQLEVIVGCVGVVSQVSNMVSKMSNTKNIRTSMRNLFGAMDDIVNYFTKYSEKKLDDIEDIAEMMPDIIDYVVDVVKSIDKVKKAIPSVKNFAGIAMPSIANIIVRLSTYQKRYIEPASENAKKLPEIFKHIWRVMEYMDGSYENTFGNLRKLSETLSSFNVGDVSGMYALGNAFNGISTSITDYCRYADVKKMDKLNVLMNRMNTFAKISNPTILRPMTRVIDKINSVEIEKAQALTETFKAFTKINSFGGFFMNFKKQVALFTEACVRLVDAINGNTDALTSENIMDEAQKAEAVPDKKSIVIANVNELAARIAESISNSSMGGGYGSDVTVDLKINGEGGDSWILRRY